MRHRKKFNHLSRKTAHRSAMLSNMASSLILKKRIKTTVAKAKALRMYVEPLITKSKTDTTHSRRIVFGYLKDKYAVTELFRDIAAECCSYLMVDMAHIAGLVAAGLHPSPVGIADFVTSTTHKTLRGPRGGFIMAEENYGAKIDKGIFPGIQGGPLMHIIAAKAVAFGEALEPDFAKYQEQVLRNSKALASELLNQGFQLVTGGTDNHLVLIDLTNFGVSGIEAEQALSQVGIVANKNAVPFDSRGPKITSGLRLGTPALTTRGLGEGDMRRIAGIIKRVLQKPKDEVILKDAKKEVMDICKSHPIYSSFDKP